MGNPPKVSRGGGEDSNRAVEPSTVSVCGGREAQYEGAYMHSGLWRFDFHTKTWRTLNRRK
jgi:hypothetical protein